MYGTAVSPEAELRVESPPHIVEAPDTMTVARGAELELQCSATGDPPPIISWLKNGIQVISCSPLLSLCVAFEL